MWGKMNLKLIYVINNLYIYIYILNKFYLEIIEPQILHKN